MCSYGIQNSLQALSLLFIRRYTAVYISCMQTHNAVVFPYWSAIACVAEGRELEMQCTSRIFHGIQAS